MHSSPFMPRSHHIADLNFRLLFRYSFPILFVALYTYISFSLSLFLLFTSTLISLYFSDSALEIAFGAKAILPLKKKDISLFLPFNSILILNSNFLIPFNLLFILASDRHLY
jgi:hypothetical protein